MVVRSQSDSERHTAAGVRTAAADPGSSAESLEWIGLRSRGSAADDRDHHRANRSATYSDDCGGAIAISVTTDHRSRGTRGSVGHGCGEGLVPRWVQFGNSHIYDDPVLHRRSGGRYFDYPRFDRQFRRRGARYRDLVRVWSHVHDSTWNG